MVGTYSAGPWSSSSSGASSGGSYRARIESINDPQKRNRVQVRLFGYQDDQGNIPKDQLEWIHVMSHDSQVPGATSTHNYYPGAEIMVHDNGTEKFVIGSVPGFDGEQRLASSQETMMDNGSNQNADVPNINRQTSADSVIRHSPGLMDPPNNSTSSGSSDHGNNTYFNYNNWQQSIIQSFYKHSTGKGLPPSPWGQGTQSKNDQLKSIALQPNQQGSDILNVIQQLDGNQSGSVQQAIQIIQNLRNNGFGNAMDVIGSGPINAALNQYVTQFGTTTQNNLINLLQQLWQYIQYVQTLTNTNFYSEVANSDVQNVITFMNNSNFGVSSNILDDMTNINMNVSISDGNANLSYYAIQLSQFVSDFNSAVSQTFTNIIIQINSIANSSGDMNTFISVFGGGNNFDSFAQYISNIGNYLGIPASVTNALGFGSVGQALAGTLSEVPTYNNPSQNISSNQGNLLMGLLAMFTGNPIAMSEIQGGGLNPQFLSNNPRKYQKKQTNEGQQVLKMFADGIGGATSALGGLLGSSASSSSSGSSSGSGSGSNDSGGGGGGGDGGGGGGGGGDGGGGGGGGSPTASYITLGTTVLQLGTSYSNITGSIIWQDTATFANGISVSSAALFNNDIVVSGGIYISSGIPLSTTNALYNNSGTLYWNGTAIGLANSFPWSELTGTPTTLSGYGISTPIPVNEGGTNVSSASGTALDNITGFSSTGYIKRTGSGSYSFVTASTILADIATTQGDILYYNGSSWVALSPGSSGQLLQTNGVAENPTWVSATGSTVSGTTGYIALFANSSVVNDSNIFQSGNNVGIGTTSPTSRLVVANTGDVQIQAINTTTGGYVTLTTNNGGDIQGVNLYNGSLGWTYGISSSNNYVIAQFGHGGVITITPYSNYYVGINNSSPNYPLDVSGSINTSNAYLVNGNNVNIFYPPGSNGFNSSFQNRDKQIVNLTDYASGSDQRTTGTISSGSNTLTLSTALDFKNGQGIRIDHAGAAWGGATVSSISGSATGGSGTTYDYIIVLIGATGGYSAPSSVASVSGGSTLSATIYNTLNWSISGSGQNNCAIYRSINGGAYGLIYITNQTSYIDTWPAADIIINGGSAFSNHPNWLPATPSGSAAASWLVTTIIAGQGTSTLTLADAATTSVSSGTVLHDDTVGFQNAVNYVQSFNSITNNYGGNIILPPNTTFNITNQITISTSSVGFTGNGWSSIIQSFYNYGPDLYFNGGITLSDGNVSGYNNFVNNLQFSQYNKTNSYAIDGSNVAQFLSDSLLINAPPCGLYFNNFNSVYLTRLRILLIWQYGGQGIYLSSSNSSRSDLCELYNISITGYSQSGSLNRTDMFGILIDGFVNTINGYSVSSIEIEGTALQTSNYAGAAHAPQFLNFTAFEHEYSNGPAVILYVGSNLYFNTPQLGEARGGAGFSIGTGTSYVTIQGGIVAGGYYDGLDILGNNVSITGVSIYNNSQSSPGGYHGIVIGASAYQVSVTGCNIGTIGNTYQDYPVFIYSGADHLSIMGNNFAGNAQNAPNISDNGSTIRIGYNAY